jgi:oxygen-dependent protoporphyrinogen oxidase
MRFDVVVVGGGVSGLVAARRLGQSGARVGLLERTSKLGGMVGTIHDDGYLIEQGPDSFLAAKGSVLRLVAELGIEHEVIWNRSEGEGSHVWWDGRLHPLPGGMLLMVPYRLGPLLGSSLLSWRGKARVLADLFIPRSGDRGDESLESFVRRRLGVEVLQRIAQPLVAGIHAAEPGTMSLHASFPRLLEMERAHRSLILAARAVALRKVAGGTSAFASFRSGMGTLVSSLALSLGDVEVRTGLVATSLDEAPSGGYRIGLGDGSEWHTEAVVLATPAPVASHLLAGLAPAAAAHLRGVTQVPGATVSLAYRSDQIPVLSGSGFVVPSAGGRLINGVSHSSRKWEGRVPDSTHSLVRVFVGERGLSGVGNDSDRLRGMIIGELEALIGISARPVRSWVTHRERGLHRYTLGHVDRVEAAETALRRRPGVVLAGAGFHGIGLNECVDSGERAAAVVSGADAVEAVGPGMGQSH